MILTKVKVPALKATGDDYNLTIDNAGNMKSEQKPTIPSDISDLTDNSNTIPENLDDLGDVVITTPIATNSLHFDGTNWVNADKRNLLGHLSLANHPFLNIQTVPPGEAPITTFVKIGDPSDTGTTQVKNILKTGKVYNVDIKIIIETETEGGIFELKLNGDVTYWDTDLTIETYGNLEMQTSMGVPEPTDVKYIGVGGVQRIYISDVPRTFSILRINGKIDTTTASDTELSVSLRNIDTISATDFSHIEIRKGTLIHSTLCN